MVDPQPVPPARVCYVFGPYLLDTANRRVIRDEQPVAITARVFELLVALVERHGHLVEKEALLDRVWGEAAVEEGNLARAVSTLRKVLGESPDDHRYIVTIPGRGYQFVAPVERVEPHVARGIAAPSGSVARLVPRAPWTLPRVAVTLGVVVVFALAAIASIRWLVPSPLSPGATRIVVLPLKNMGAANVEYVAAGLTEEITTRLAMVDSLRVLSRTSAGGYERSGKTAREIGAGLDADYLVEGSVLWQAEAHSDRRVRITAQLIRTADDSHVWSDTFDRDVDDFFKVQSEIAVRIVRALKSTLLAGERRALESVPTSNAEAYRAYLQGIFYALRPDLSEENMGQSIRHLDRAVHLDPRFGEAQAALANAHASYYEFGYDPSVERRQLMLQALERAEREGPTLPTTHRARARYWLTIGGDPTKALTAAEEAERRWPNRADVVATAGVILFRLGRWNEAAARVERARDLNPRSASAHATLGLMLVGLRRYPQAQHALDRSLVLEPDQGMAYVLKVWNTWLWKGDLDATRSLVNDLPQVHDWRLMELRFLQSLYERNYDAALSTLAPWSGEWMRTLILARPVVLFDAQVRRLRGDLAGARASFDEARVLLEAEVQATPSDGRLRASLGVAYAGLGRKADALREARHALELMPNPDGFDTSVVREDAALAATMVGDHETALAHIDRLLASPAHFSVQSLRLDPRWDSLPVEKRYGRLGVIAR